MIETSGATIANNSESLSMHTGVPFRYLELRFPVAAYNSIQTILPGYADPFRADGGKVSTPPPPPYDD